MDKVFIEGLEIEALIGIYDWERRIRQPLVFDLEMQFDNRVPAASDAIADTLDYKAVSKRVIEYVGASQFGLVETLAERVAGIILDEFAVEYVRLKLSKPGAVRGARAVGVMIERTRVAGAPRAPRAIREDGLHEDRGDETLIAPPAVTVAAPAAAEALATQVEPIAASAADDAAASRGTSQPDSATSASPFEAALSAAVSGWHAPRMETEAATGEATADIAPADADDHADAPASAASADDVATQEPPTGFDREEDAAPLEPTPTDADAVAIDEVGAEDRAAGEAAVDEAAVDEAAVDEAAVDEAETGDVVDTAEPVAASEPAESAGAAPYRADFMHFLDEAPMIQGIDLVESPEASETAAASAPHADAMPAAPEQIATGQATPATAVPEAQTDSAIETRGGQADAPVSAAPMPTTESASASAPTKPAERPLLFAAAVAPGRPAEPPARAAPPPPPRPRNPASDLGRTTRPAYLSLGSNIEPEQNLRSALMALRARFGEVIVSPVYRMPAVGFDGPDFLNAAAIIDSDLDPFALTRWLHGIENAHGRIRSHVKNSSRTLDMDIIFFDDLVLDMPGGLQLPRPELRHAFVLKPLVDIAPGFVDPVRGVHLADVWASHPEREKRFSTVMI